MRLVREVPQRRRKQYDVEQVLGWALLSVGTFQLMLHLGFGVPL